MTIQLTKDAFELLAEASKDNHGIVSRARTFGGMEIQTNGRSFAEMGNARSEARWDSALNELIDYGLVKDRGFKGEVFEVTHLGYQVVVHGLPAEEESGTDEHEAIGFLSIAGKDG